MLEHCCLNSIDLIFYLLCGEVMFLWPLSLICRFFSFLYELMVSVFFSVLENLEGFPIFYNFSRFLSLSLILCSLLFLIYLLLYVFF